MDRRIEDKLAILDVLARADPEYQELLEELGRMEDVLDELERNLTGEQSTIIWDFWQASSSVELKKLEIACRYMEFK